MKTQFNINDFLEITEIRNELDYERALIADRKLRKLSKENAEYKSVRNQLRTLISAYESKNWNKDSVISEQKIKESDLAEYIAEQERQFIEDRKLLIKSKLKKIKLTQQDFGTILGHNSKSYMSELMNGVSPFSLKDLIVINRLFNIDLTDLIPTFLPHNERVKIKSTIQKLDKPNLKLSIDGFALEEI